MQQVRTPFSKALDTAVRGALAYLDGLDTSPVGATAGLDDLRARLGKPLNDASINADDVIAQLLRDVDGGIVGSAGGRFFAWVIGGSLPAALAADWLTSAWDQNAALYACGPAAAVVEEVAGSWLKELLGLPASASFAFTTGCQMAHVTCLAAARHSLLTARGWKIEEDGLFGAPPVRVLTSDQRHGSVDRALRLLGLGTQQMRFVAVDEDGRMRIDALETALLDADSTPTILLLQAGDINTGTFDAFSEAIALARRYGAWTHVDGAFGLWAAASPRYRHLTDGVAGADSWSTDGHKWLNVPFDCGYAFIRDAESHRASMSHRAAYIAPDAQARDQIDWNPEWSRRARGFPTYAALRQLGRDGVAALVDACCDRAAELVRAIGELPGAEILRHPIIDQGLIRFRSPALGASDEDHDVWTDAVIAEIAATGATFFSGSTWRGRRVMRVSVVNWSTSSRDVRVAVDAIASVLRRRL